MANACVAAFGEVMLRLAPPGKKRLEQALPGPLEATFGGGEANVCASLAILGARARYLTALPDNPVARAFARQLAGLGVDVSGIRWAKDGRMGVYYAEHGSGPRGSNVVYDREDSVIARSGPADYDFPALLAGAARLHLTGITPALSAPAAAATLAAAEAATDAGAAVSIDLNFRKKLWNWEPGTAKKALAGRVMEKLVGHASVIIANEEDAADVFDIHADNTVITDGRIDPAGYVGVAEKLAAKFPRAKFVAVTLRESLSADHNNWGGLLYDAAAKQAHFGPLDADGRYAPYELRDIVDRFGGGDSFGAGLLYALDDAELSDPAVAVRFAAAASALKHTISGDYNYSRRADVLNLMGGNASGRVMR